MSDLAQDVKDSALKYAQAGDLDNANRILRLGLSYGVSEEEIETTRQKAVLVYLLSCGKSLHFGVVQHNYYQFSTIGGGKYIGISSYASSKFFVENPVYKKQGDNHEVLVSLNHKWFYGNFTQTGDFYGGQVVSADEGILGVIPFFATEGIKGVKALTSYAIRELKGADSHVWELPENFDMAPSEYKATQQDQTWLALDSLGLIPTKRELYHRVLKIWKTQSSAAIPLDVVLEEYR